MYVSCYDSAYYSGRADADAKSVIWAIDGMTRRPVGLVIVGHPVEAYLELPKIVRGQLMNWDSDDPTTSMIKGFLISILRKDMDDNPLNVVEYVKQWRMIGYQENMNHYIHVRQEHRKDLDETIKKRAQDLSAAFMGITPVWRETEIDPMTKMFVRHDWDRSGWYKLPEFRTITHSNASARTSARASNGGFGIGQSPEFPVYRELARPLENPSVQNVLPGKPFFWVDPTSRKRPTTLIYIHVNDIAPIKKIDLPRGCSADPLIAYIDIETMNGKLKGFPAANVPADITYLCSFVTGTAGSTNGGVDLSKVDKMCICVGYPDLSALAPDIDVRSVASEDALYDELAVLIREENPDVISGFNIHRYDLKYIEDRIAYSGQTFGNISRLPGHSSELDLLRGPRGARYTNLKCPGRIVIDMFIYLFKSTSRQEVGSFSLKNLSAHYLKSPDLQKIDLGYEDQFRMYLKYLLGFPGGPADLAKLVEYCVQDSAILHALFDHRGTWNTLMQDSNIRGMTIQSAAVAGQVECLTPYLYRQVKMANTCMEVNLNMLKFKFEGGFVHLSRPGLHRYMVIGDFASLYPAIMIEGNKCWTTRVLEEDTLNFVQNHAPSDYRITNVDYEIPSTVEKRGGSGSGGDFDPVDAIEDDGPSPYTEGQIYESKDDGGGGGEAVDNANAISDGESGGESDGISSEGENDGPSSPIAPYVAPPIIPGGNLGHRHRQPLPEEISKLVAKAVRKGKQMMAPNENMTKRNINVMYVSPAVKMGIIPNALDNLMSVRANIRDVLMPEYEKKYEAARAAGDDVEYHRLYQIYDDLDKQQSATKVAANSIYGITGAVASYADPFIGMTTTSNGRVFIKKSTELIIADDPVNRRHVYSDTDSSMVIDDSFSKLDLTCLNRAIVIDLGLDREEISDPIRDEWCCATRRILAEWSRERTKLEHDFVFPIVKRKCVEICKIPDRSGIYGEPMKFEFEAFVVVGMWFKKKFYICRVMDPKGNIKLKQRGILLRRGDYPEVVKRMYGDACFGLLDGFSMKEIMLRIAGHVRTILLGPTLTFEECRISSDYKSLADYKSSSCKMAVLAHRADQMGIPIAEYSRVDFVMVNPGGNLAGASILLEKGGKSEHLATADMFHEMRAEPDRDHYFSVSISHIDTLISCAASSTGGHGDIAYYAASLPGGGPLIVPGRKCPACSKFLSHHIGGTGAGAAFQREIQSHVIFYACIFCAKAVPVGSTPVINHASHIWKYDRPMESFKKIYAAFLSHHHQRPVGEVRAMAIEFLYKTIHEIY